MTFPTLLLENIHNQPQALRQVAAHQSSPSGIDALKRAAVLIRAHKRIVFSGMGASHFASLSCQHQFASQGVDVQTVDTAELLYFERHLLKPDTLFVLVSRSGESIETVKLLNSPSLTAIGITNVPNSTLANHAACCLQLGSPADQLVAIQTYIATEAVLTLLAAELAGEREQADGELLQTAQILESIIPGWIEARTGSSLREAFLNAPHPIYILGRGPSLGSVHEGVLLMHETAKFPAIGMSVPQFRHGPVEAVGSNLYAVVIGTQPETASLDSAFALDIASRGAQVRWLGPGGANPLFPWPSGIPSRFTQLVETIPLQIAAYTKAEVAGIEPGTFRWASAITSSETGFPGSPNS